MIVKTKPVTREGINDFYLIMGACGYILNKMPDLQGTHMYQRELKNKAKLFYKECEKVERIIANPGVKVHATKQEESEAMEQMHQSYLYFETMLQTIFTIPDDKLKEFDNVMNTVVNYYVNASNLSPQAQNQVQILERIANNEFSK